MPGKRPPRAVDAVSRDEPADEVVLLDDNGTPVGTADRVALHGPDTPLHLGFSVHLLDSFGRVLLTRRALTVPGWPGVWTVSCHGHPRPHESFTVAVARCVNATLGVHITDLRLLLDEFRFRAVDADGLVENEIGPVFSARVAGTVAPDPARVMEFVWVDPHALVAAAEQLPQVFSPWAARQYPLLAEQLTNPAADNQTSG